MKTYKYKIQKWVSPAEDKVIATKLVNASCEDEASDKVWGYASEFYPEFDSIMKTEEL